MDMSVKRTGGSSVGMVQGTGIKKVSVERQKPTIAVSAGFLNATRNVINNGDFFFGLYNGRLSQANLCRKSDHKYVGKGFDPEIYMIDGASTMIYDRISKMHKISLVEEVFLSKAIFPIIPEEVHAAPFPLPSGMWNVLSTPMEPKMVRGYVSGIQTALLNKIDSYHQRMGKSNSQLPLVTSPWFLPALHHTFSYCNIMDVLYYGYFPKSNRSHYEFHICACLRYPSKTEPTIIQLMKKNESDLSPDDQLFLSFFLKPCIEKDEGLMYHGTEHSEVCGGIYKRILKMRRDEILAEIKKYQA